MDCDGKISPKDIVDFQIRYCTETNYLLAYDITELTNKLKSKMSTEPPVVQTAESIIFETTKKLEKFDPYEGYEDPESVGNVTKVSDGKHGSEESFYGNMAGGMNNLNKSGSLQRKNTAFEKHKQSKSLKSEEARKTLASIERKGPDALIELRQNDPVLFAKLMRVKTESLNFEINQQNKALINKVTNYKDFNKSIEGHLEN